eukprot:6993-Eustigmatos_ZCMA.PRE.1
MPMAAGSPTWPWTTPWRRPIGWSSCRADAPTPTGRCCATKRPTCGSPRRWVCAPTTSRSCTARCSLCG